jgi:hypothetical protein
MWRHMLLVIAVYMAGTLAARAAEFQAHVDYGTGSLVTRSVVLADLNGDGNPDIIAANQDTVRTVSVLLGKVPSSFPTAL